MEVLNGNNFYMKKLLDYFNGLSDRERQDFLNRSGITVGYLRKACSVGQRLNCGYCVAIEKATGGAVSRKDLRPDDWHLIWPELEGR